MAWDFLMFILTAGLLIYVPMLIAFYEPQSTCMFVGGRAPPPLSAASLGPGVASIPRSGTVFFSLTNVAFLVRRAGRS